jgi:hypothetical protein
MLLSNECMDLMIVQHSLTYAKNGQEANEELR